MVWHLSATVSRHCNEASRFRRPRAFMPERRHLWRKTCRLRFAKLYDQDLPSVTPLRARPTARTNASYNKDVGNSQMPCRAIRAMFNGPHRNARMLHVELAARHEMQTAQLAPIADIPWRDKHPGKCPHTRNQCGVNKVRHHTPDPCA